MTNNVLSTMQGIGINKKSGLNLNILDLRKLFKWMKNYRTGSIPGDVLVFNFEFDGKPTRLDRDLIKRIDIIYKKQRASGKPDLFGAIYPLKRYQQQRQAILDGEGGYIMINLNFKHLSNDDWDAFGDYTYLIAFVIQIVKNDNPDFDYITFNKGSISM